MSPSLSSWLPLFALAIAAAFVAYVPARRPHERSSWAIAGAAAGLLIYYLCDFLLYRPGVSVQTGFVLQKIGLQGTGVARITTVALVLALRETPAPRWEKVLALVLVAETALGMAFIGTLVPRPSPACTHPAGVPALHCGLSNDVTTSIVLIGVTLTFWLFYRTFRLASDARRRIFLRYMLPAVLLICLAMATNLVWGFWHRGPGLPSVMLTLPAAALAARGLLVLEEADRGLHLSRAGKLFIGWVALLVLSVALDAFWQESFPVVSLVTLVGGLGLGMAHLAGRVVALESQGPPANALPKAEAPTQETTVEALTEEAEAKAPASEATPAAPPPPPPRLDIHLFGPLRVERDGVRLAGDATTWRSDKSKSLLAYLIIARDLGVTRTQLVDALWPIGDDGDGEAEKHSINAVRSYLSTLRKVLEPDRPRGRDGLIPLEGERYYLRNSEDVRVDVWEFERLAHRAEQLAKAGRPSEAAESWEQALALHGELGLLPDEIYLPPEVVEPERERLRQRWLMGLRWLGRRYAENGPVERAVAMWETVWHAVPLDREAYRWLAAHYAATGQAERLRVVEDRRHRNEGDAAAS